MQRTRTLRRLTATLILTGAVAIGASGCILAAPAPYVVGPPVVVAPRPGIFVGPAVWHGPYYRRGYYRGW